MIYRAKSIKDEEVKGLLYLLEDILDACFGQEFSTLSDAELQNFIDETDAAENTAKSISLVTFKKIFELLSFDTEYRPKYETINFLLFGLHQRKISFKTYIKEHQKEIDAEFAEMDYDVKLINPEKKETAQLQTLSIGTQGGIQINLDQAAVQSLFRSIAFRFGDILTEQEEFSNIPKVLQEYSKNRAFKRMIRTEEIRQSNSENIIAKATQFIRGLEEKTEQVVDQDWMSEFFNISQDCSNETMQYLWAKILANEVDAPGSFSRRTLHALKLLESEEASIFNLLCNCLWTTYPGDTRADKVLFKNSNNEGKYSDATWGFDSHMLQHLEDLGFVHTTYMILEKGNEIPVQYFDKQHILKTNQNAVEIEIVRLSSIGEELYEVVHTTKNLNYYEHTIGFMESLEYML